MTTPDTPRDRIPRPARPAGRGAAGSPRTRTAVAHAPTTVTAVVVTRGATPYLDATIAAVRAQEHAPDRLLVVDVVRDADRRARLAPADDDTLATVLVHVPRATSFGAAVRAGLEHLADLGQAPAPDPTTWLWLLHDDATPAPGALDALVRAVEHAPSVVLAGAKQVEPGDRRRLVEVGLTTSPAGRRMSSVEPGETDQGQHDGTVDVLGVGFAGAIARLDVWTALDGPDPEYGNVGDGLEYSRRARLAGHRVIVVPGAVVAHARATYLDLRRRETVPDHEPDEERSFALRRRAELWYRLTGAPTGLVWLHLVVVALLALPRALWQLGAKRGRRARAEITATAWTILRPVALWRSRRRVRRARVLPRSALVPLQASWRDVLVARRDRRLARTEQRRARARGDAFALAERRADLRRRVLGVALTAVGLVGLTLWWLGPALSAAGSGARLVSPALPLAGGSLADMWAEVADGWVRAGVGDAVAADPLLTVLLPFVALVTPFGGNLQTVVDLTLLASLVVAGLGAWLAAGTATKSLLLRSAAALAWVATPVLAAGLGAGRFGDLLAHVALPWAVWGALKGVGLGARPPVERAVVAAARRAEARRLERESAASDDGEDAYLAAAGAAATPVADATMPAARPVAHASVPAAAFGGLALAVAVAGAPVLLVPALVALALVGLLRGRPRPRGARRHLLLVAVPPVLVVVPLVAEVVRRGLDAWPLLLASPGRPVPTEAPAGWRLLLGEPTVLPRWPWAEGLPLPDAVQAAVPLVLGGLVVVCALLALVRRDRAGAVRGAWLVAALALAAGAAASTVVVGAGDLGEVRASAGGAVSLVVLALLGAALVGLDHVTDRVASHAFGWRQLALVLFVVVGVGASGLALARGAALVDLRDPQGLHVLEGDVVPAVGRQMQEPPRSARVLRLDAGATTTFQLLRGDGPQLADVSVVRDHRALTAGTDAPAQKLAGVVARLVGGVVDDGAALVDLGVGAVLVAPGTDDDARGALVARLDANGVLERVADGPTGTVWRVAVAAGDAEGTTTVTGWARLLDGSGAGVVVPSDGRGIDVRLPSTGTGDLGVTAGLGWDVQPGTRTLVLAERAAPGWRATLDGHRLETAQRLPEGAWQQTFALPADGGGSLEVWYESPGGTWWRVVLVATAVIYGLLVVPVRRRVVER
ncbi:glycosyltransferase [Sanguibacter sp. HDW7]|uniref:glycosyltransferase n=1 Tax=Sanguibacter sp. HDW7 TaxID=2714931 RepID=UPI00140A1DC2|nr:glycosyltransferase [Sanguibacter sp. HDW7]QIK82850.1 glycosyltransferase [Sanguibacter sp. HDW7]